MSKSRTEFIEAIGKIVDSSDRMLLVVNENVEVRAPFFNYADMQKFTYLLQRTSCEWWIKPIDEKMVMLRVRLF